MSAPKDSESCYAYARKKKKPSAEKASRLVHAAGTNNVEVLRELLDSPEWYYTTDKNGHFLLRCTIECGCKEAFDFLLSLPDLDIDHAEIHDRTALSEAWYAGCGRQKIEYFMCELIRKGASVDKGCIVYDSLLQCALENSYTDVVMALLEAGAVPCIADFETSVGKNLAPWIQEILFLYTFDKYTNIEFETLCELATRKSPLFHEILKFSDNVILEYWPPYFFDSIDVDYIEGIVKTNADVIREILDQCGPMFCENLFADTICLEKLNVLIESELKHDVISSMNSKHIFAGDKWLIGEYAYSARQVVDTYLYLLSYGLIFTEWDLQCIYRHVGYSEEFKIFLHMDIKLSSPRTGTMDIFPMFLYDVNMDLQKLLQNPPQLTLYTICEMLCYFAHPRLAQICRSLKFGEEEEVSIPQMPLLLELARNAFRKYLVEKYKIKNSRTFYTIINHLPISVVYKRIITLETELYY